MAADTTGPLGEVQGAPMVSAPPHAVFDVGKSGRAGWRAELELAFEPRNGRTAIGRQRHLGPLRVQRPFYPERNGTCHVYVLHPPGGVVGGDELSISVAASAGARALLTTPGATKLYRSLGQQAQLRQRIGLGGDACLEWFPQETIAFAGTNTSIATCVQLSERAAFAGWDVVCLGRPAAGEAFGTGRLRIEQRIERSGRLQWIERAEFLGGDAMLHAAWGMAGHTVIGTFVIAPATAPDAGWIDDLRAQMGEVAPDGAVRERSAPPPNFSATLVSSTLILRYLGDHAHQAMSFFRRAWRILRPRYAASAVAPRIWHT